ncbi:MAG: bifunctional methylenetetrahydrofolate dehydrogenase/methenyltetrahydrofolate cyclohydrolase, partial [Dyella sp.]|nr:bifunctional methylenetetrahydrofolate dehydrogenase/methenyltetrahydrofolate cyclohydrolase [Dyella sp.]
MTARILDGKRIAQELMERIERRVAERKGKGLAEPGLAVVLVGDDAASSVYVRNKRKACHQVGFRSFDFDLPSSTTQDELIALIDRLNADPAVHGILVQLPLPRHIDEAAVIRAVSPLKDVDGFSPENLGLLAAGFPRYLPPTPHGVQQLLLRNGVAV